MVSTKLILIRGRACENGGILFMKGIRESIQRSLIASLMCVCCVRINSKSIICGTHQHGFPPRFHPYREINICTKYYPQFHNFIPPNFSLHKLLKVKLGEKDPRDMETHFFSLYWERERERVMSVLCDAALARCFSVHNGSIFCIDQSSYFVHGMVVLVLATC